MGHHHLKLVHGGKTVLRRISEYLTRGEMTDMTEVFVCE